MNPLNYTYRIEQAKELLLDSHEDVGTISVDVHFDDKLEDGSICSYVQFIARDRTRYGVFALWKEIDGLWELMEFRTGEMR